MGFHVFGLHVGNLLGDVRWGGRREHCLATRASRRASLGTVRSSSRAALDAMIAEATVDCYNDSECITGFYTMLEEHLDMPFQTVVLGSRPP